MSEFLRAYALEDIHVLRGGDGRTVEAYAAVFDTPVPISDRDGQYLEIIDRAAFNKTLGDNGTRFGVFYNHARDLYGNPSDRFSMPIGKPEEVRVDDRGVFTRTRYARTEVADEVLELIRAGAITAQSFSGSFVRSDPKTPRGGFRPDADGNLRTVRRLEVRMREYGPTPFPAYADAAITGVRAEALAARLTDMPADERNRLIELLAATLTGRTDETDTSAPEAVAPAETPEPQPHSDRHVRNHQHLRRQAREEGGPLS